MVKFKIEIPEVPRREIDRLENVLDKLFYQKEDDRWEWGWGSSYTNGKEEGPYYRVGMRYRLNRLLPQPGIEIDAKGTSEKGNFKVCIDVDMPDKDYSQMEGIISQEVPAIGKILEKKSKINTQ